ncbi:MAG: hypothetical protein GF383_05805 [Candidatus Lokiarchaeota archaeon]|nr:hypothetical protein [Candidatus Lokiarchaeota archaeon]MBD3339446.1 hypothetical protein [Candidatus Lokiarchaeota archaeon]
MNDMTHRVLIDTDPGLGKRSADVDDGLALFFMFNHPDAFEIKGITTVFGNTKVKTGFRLLKKYLDLVGREDTPHYLGASSSEDLGTTTLASEFLINRVKEHPKDLTLIALGPLTNVATAYQLYPEILDDIKELVVMGGVLNPINPFSEREDEIGRQFFENAEFNFMSDPKATQIIIEAETSTPRKIFGLDICCKAVFKKAHLQKIESIDRPIPQYITKNVVHWLKIWEFSDKKGFFPFDTFVPIYLLHPNLFEFASYQLRVDLETYPGKIEIIDENPQNENSVDYSVDFAINNGEEQFLKILITGLIQ